MTTNESAAKAIEELIGLMKLSGLKGPDRFKVKHYEKTVNVLRNLTSDVSAMDKDTLKGIGIGDSTGDKIIEFFKTGKVHKVEEYRKSTPPAGIFEFTKLRGVGPVGAKKLWRSTGASNMTELIQLADLGKISDESLLKSIVFYKTASERLLLLDALKIINPVFKTLKKLPCVKKISNTGSIIRRKDTVHDADILVLTDKNSISTIVEEFCKFAEEVSVKGDTKTSILKEKFQIDLTIITDPLEWGGALFHASGPAEYNVRNRMIAKSKSWMLNDKGLWDSQGNRLDDGTEQSICDLLDIPWIEPELRDLNICKKIVTEQDITADLHVHSKYSDGNNDVEDILKVAKQRGLKAIAITDHGKKLAMAGIKDFEEYVESMKVLQLKEKDIRLLIGVEANIDKEGNLDYTSAEFDKLDIVVASIHNAFELSKEQQTTRLIKAIENPATDVIGHCTGEDYGTRKAMDIDWIKVFEACVSNKVAIEVNNISSRIGLSPQLLSKAREMGVKFSYGSDSHYYSLEVDDLSMALWRMRKAGITKEDLYEG